MKQFLLIMIIVILAVLLILIGSACDKKANINGTIVSETKAVVKDKIAYIHSIHGDYRNREIFIMNIDGSEQTQLTDSSGDDFDPCFSADGTKIAFVSDRDGNNEIYIMNIDGSDQINLSNNPTSDHSPNFSPDGTMITFASNRDGNTEIYMMKVDGSEQTNLTNHQKADTDPCFSPGGSKICFTSGRDKEERYFEIYIMNADGSEQTRLTYDIRNWVSLPCFSSDGSKIAFREPGGISTINTDGSNPENIIPNITSDEDLRLSLDWSKIAVVRGGEPEMEGDGILVFTIDAYFQSTGDYRATSLTKYPAKGISPCFSP